MDMDRNRTKSICFADYDVVGFDCDHTLAQYHLYHLFKDSYEAMANYLVEKKGYKKELFCFNPSFCSRGIVLDLETGNFMKLSHNGIILRAFHGTKPLSKSEYCGKVWPHCEELCVTMTNIGSRYRVFENFFDMASSLLCAQIIDYLDEQHNGKPPSYDVWPEVVPAIKHVYIPEPFKAKDGWFFKHWMKDRGRFMEEWNEKLRDWLIRMKMSNRPMFILSSAYQDMIEETLQFILGKDWENYFELCVFLAEKPRFFYKDDSFYQLDETSSKQIVISDLIKNKRSLGGNFKEFNHHLSLITGKPNPKVLYFGDSLRSDIIPAKRYANWDTVLIFEEMACETPFYKLRTDNLKIEPCDPEDSHSMPWGSVLADGIYENAKPSKVQTLIHYTIQRHADIAIPNLQFLLDFPLGHKFTTFNPTEDSSLSGFHPFTPHVLQRLC